MEGFGVHTFRLVNAAGKSRLVKFHWKPLLGRALAGLGRGAEDRRQGPRLPPPRPLGGDRGGRLPGVRAGRADRRRGGRARSSASTCSTRRSSCPRSWCPVRRVGKLTLNRNPDNFFAETEQVAFCVGQRRARASTSPTIRCCRRGSSRTSTRSYAGSGGPNFAEIPINRPLGAGAQPPAGRATCARPSTPARPSTTRTPSAAAARTWPRREPAPTSTTPEPVDGAQDPRAERELQGPLQPGHAVLPQPLDARAAAPHRGVPVRARQGRAQGDPPARGRSLRAHRRRAREGGGVRRRGYRTARQGRPGPAPVARPQHGQHRARTRSRAA